MYVKEKVFELDSGFSFNNDDPDTISFEIKGLDSKRFSMSTDILTKIIKIHYIFFHYFIQDLVILIYLLTLL